MAKAKPSKNANKTDQLIHGHHIVAILGAILAGIGIWTGIWLWTFIGGLVIGGAIANIRWIKKPESRQ